MSDISQHPATQRRPTGITCLVCNRGIYPPPPTHQVTYTICLVGLSVAGRALIDWGLGMPSWPPISASSSVTGIKGYTLIGVCKCRIPCLNEFTYRHGGSFSNDGSSTLVVNQCGVRRIMSYVGFRELLIGCESLYNQ